MDKVLTVSQLNNYIKGVFDDELILGNISVVGEIFELSIGASATFFTLKENDSLLNCVSFSALNDLKIGQVVTAEGTVRFYGKSGRVSLNVRNVKLRGEGDIAAKFAALKQRLLEEGVFSNNRAIPRPVRRIALVTSVDGAVIHDFIRVLRGGAAAFCDVAVFPVKVQGEGAAKQISDTMSDINKGKVGNFDLIVLARGGGSATDLDEFNDENLARTVAACPYTVVSAIGHETNYVLCDYAADVRAGTPSIAGELINSANREFFESLSRLVDRIGTAAKNMYSVRASAVRLQAYRTVYGMSGKLDGIRHSLKYNSEVIRNSLFNAADNMERRVRAAVTEQFHAAEIKLRDAEARAMTTAGNLRDRNPSALLERGYAKVLCGGKEISSVAEASGKIEIVMRDGVIGAEVYKTEKR